MKSVSLSKMQDFDSLFSIIQSAWRGGRTWSLSEIGGSEENYRDLMNWCRSLGHYEYDRLASLQSPKLGAVLLWLHAEVMRRHGGEGELWLVLANRSVVPWQDYTWARLYNSGGHLLPSHGKHLEKAVQMLGLRHAFNEPESKRWYQLIYLQFGFTHEDATRRLSAWLSGQAKPVSVEKLLAGHDDGAHEFQRMWSTLRQFKLGNVSRRNMERHLRSCCWVLPEWTDDLLKAASEAEVAWADEEEMEDEVFFTAPRLVWDELGAPSFQVELCNLKGLPDDSDLELRCGGTLLRRLLLQTDGGLALDGDSVVTLGVGAGLKPQIELRLVADDGTLVRHGVATLWNGDSDVSLLRPSDGNLITERQLRHGQSFQAITFEDLTFDPPPDERTSIGAGYVLHRYRANWSGEIRAQLDGLVVWSSAAFGAPPPPPPLDVLQVRWREILDFTQVVKPSPWKTSIEIRVLENEWAFAGMSWPRADGRLMRFKWLPEHLSLVEADAARPIRVRVALRHQSGRTSTVPITLPPPMKGCLRWSENGRPHVQHGDKTMLAADAQRVLWSFFLPTVKDANGMSVEVESSACSFMEGDAVRGRLRTRAGILPIVAGYGAPAWITNDPYNSDERLLAVASRVIDGGVIGQVRFEEQRAIIPRVGNFELGPDHRLVGWFSAKDKPGTLTQPVVCVSEGEWEFILPEGCWLVGLVLLYQGTRLGSWFDSHKWSSVMLKSDAASAASMAALLRVWKAPLLHEQGTTNQRAAVISWLRREWREVLPVWLAKDGLLQGTADEEWPCPPLTDHWKGAVQSLLSEALPRPNPEDCLDFIKAISGTSSDQVTGDMLGAAVMDLIDVCPLLAVRIFEAASGPAPSGNKALSASALFAPLQAINPCSDQIADGLASNHGGRDGVWLRSCIPSLHELNQPYRSLPLAYRRLATNSEFRKFAFGTWLKEFRSRLHL